MATTTETGSTGTTRTTSIAQSWLKQHESIIIVLAVLITFIFCFNKYIDYNANKKEEANTVATVAAAQAKAAADSAKEESESEIKKYQDMVTELEKQNNLLLSTIENDNILLAKQQQRDADLSLPDLSTRWNQLTNIPDGATVVNDRVSVTSNAAHETVNQLESVPVLKEEVNKGSQILENKENELSEANKVNLDLTQQNKSDILLLAQKDKECNTEVSAIKATATKSKRNWLVRGLVIGASVTSYLFLRF